MKALLRRFAHLPAHPEFAFPGLLMLCSGIAFGVSTFFLDDDLAFWLLAALTLASGAALLLKTRVGTALLIATMILNLCHGWRLPGFLGLALGLAFTATMALCVLMQFQFHKGRASRLALPPRN